MVVLDGRCNAESFSRGRGVVDWTGGAAEPCRASATAANAAAAALSALPRPSKSVQDDRWDDRAGAFGARDSKGKDIGTTGFEGDYHPSIFSTKSPHHSSASTVGQL